MKNFTYSISTVVHFGKGQISKLGGEIASRASRVLVVYGGGSIKRNGVYEGAAEQMKAHGADGHARRCRETAKKYFAEHDLL